MNVENTEQLRYFVIVTGSIGAGKTSLTKLVSTRLGWQAGYESVDDNPYLEQFYVDMGRWVFHLGMYFLGSRIKQHIDLANSEASAILDRSIYEDAHVFIPALRQLGVFGETDYQTYTVIWDLLNKTLPKPNLVVYLYAPVDTLLERIRTRDRPMERAIAPDYLSLLESYYELWIDSFALCPVLKIDTSVLDIAKNSQDQEYVIGRITDKLRRGNI